MFNLLSQDHEHEEFITILFLFSETCDPDHEMSQNLRCRKLIKKSLLELILIVSYAYAIKCHFFRGFDLFEFVYFSPRILFLLFSHLISIFIFWAGTT